MANSASAQKRARQNIKRRARNMSIKAALRTAARKAEKAIAEGNLDEATTLVAQATRAFDKAVAKNVLHKNTAARGKSRLVRKFNAASAG